MKTAGSSRRLSDSGSGFEPDPMSMSSLPTISSDSGAGTFLGSVDQYLLVRKLGGGGFGVVYLARDSVSGVDVALKNLHPLLKRNAEEMDKLREKFALVSRLAHPSIATALVLHPVRSVEVSDPEAARELGLSAGDHVMVMRYAPGVTLSQWRRQFDSGIVPPAVAAEVVRQIASALDYAHSERIVHRDIKPANVMVETQESGFRVRLLDFGLAAEIRSSMSRVSNETGDTSGTRPYMSPEQWSGLPQDGRTDQYALACVVYELLSGAPPFAGVFETGDPAIMRSAVQSEPPRPVPGLPRAANDALLRALAKQPSARFPSCTAFAEALAAGAGGKVSSLVPGRLGRMFSASASSRHDSAPSVQSARTAGTAPAPAAPRRFPAAAAAVAVVAAALFAAIGFSRHRENDFAPPDVDPTVVTNDVVDVTPAPEPTPQPDDDLVKRKAELVDLRRNVGLMIEETAGYSSWQESPFAGRRAIIARDKRTLDGLGFTPDELVEARKAAAEAKKARDWMVDNATARKTADKARSDLSDASRDAKDKYSKTVSAREFSDVDSLESKASEEFAEGKYSDAENTCQEARNKLDNAVSDAEGRIANLKQIVELSRKEIDAVEKLGHWNEPEWNEHLGAFKTARKTVSAAVATVSGLAAAEKALRTMQNEATWLAGEDGKLQSQRNEKEARTKRLAALSSAKNKGASEAKKIQPEHRKWKDKAFSDRVAAADEAAKALRDIPADADSRAGEASRLASEIEEAVEWMKSNLQARKDIDASEKEIAKLKRDAGELDIEVNHPDVWNKIAEACKGAASSREKGDYAGALRSLSSAKGCLKAAIPAAKREFAANKAAFARKKADGGHWAEAVDWARRALEFDPGNAEAKAVLVEAGKMTQPGAVQTRLRETPPAKPAGKRTTPTQTRTLRNE